MDDQLASDDFTIRRKLERSRQDAVSDWQRVATSEQEQDEN